MLAPLKPTRLLSIRAAWITVACIVGSIAVSALDGLIRLAPQASQSAQLALQVWVTDLRYLLTQGIYAGTIFWIGAKFVETRTMLTVGFDRLDAGKLSIKGPDDSHVVWIGRKYGERLEAEAVAAALEERLRRSLEE